MGAQDAGEGYCAEVGDEIAGNQVIPPNIAESELNQAIEKPVGDSD